MLIRITNFQKKYFLRNVLKSIGLVGLWRSISGIPVDDSKIFFPRIPLSEIVTMYSVYHEMDIGHFIEDMNKRYMSITQEIHLKTIRENRGISQVELAALSGVKLRSIQMYEQKVNDIDKAQARTLYKLSRVLGCSIEDLLENPEL